MNTKTTIVLFLVFPIAACAGRVSAPDLGTSVADSAAIRSDIAYLASDRLEGRLTGTAGNDSAAAYIARRYKYLKLNAPYQGYLQSFVARSAASAHAGDTAGKKTQNVVAILKGSDPLVSGNYIVVGAHFDHLGRSTQFAMDPQAGDAIRNGADDNASGTAAVMQLARMLSITRPRHSIIFVNFSGEEEGLLGSQYFVENSPVPLDSIVAMFNFDMVGRLKDDKLFKLAIALEKVALEDDYFVKRKLYPNVDFYSGIVYKALGIPVAMFTAIFALARTVGWIAQWNELISDPDQKIGRPRQLFTGAERRDFVPMAKRK